MFFFTIFVKKNIYLFIYYSSALCNSANSLTL